MTRGLSIHIGLNCVDVNAYQGWGCGPDNGQLAGCENDARSMQAIATSQGYTTTTLLTSQATSAAVISEIVNAANTLESGDILLLTYSGHGGEVPDPTGTEPSGKNQTWVLYDRMVIDDELYALWGRFQGGVRIFVLSDSCHSGTVTRDVEYVQALAGNEHLIRAYSSSVKLAAPGTRSIGPGIGAPTFRRMPQPAAQKHYKHNKVMYDTISTYTPKDIDVKATVVLISGCQDNQLSADGDGNGLFTEKLLAVWNNGTFSSGYSQFASEIVRLMPPTQTPNYYVVGAPDPTFEAQRPFSIAGQGGQTGGFGGGGSDDWSGATDNGWGDQSGTGDSSGSDWSGIDTTSGSDWGQGDGYDSGTDWSTGADSDAWSSAGGTDSEWGSDDDADKARSSAIANPRSRPLSDVR